MWARLAGFLVLASVAVGCGGRDNMHGTFQTLSETLPPGAGVPSTDEPVSATPSPCASGPACRGKPVRTGVFDADALPEASGAVVSRRDPGLLWLVDDREGTDELWAVSVDGRHVARLRVQGMDAVNAESLAAGPCSAEDPEPCLYVGDIGDNTGGREHVRVLRVREPDLDQGPPPAATPDIVTLRYPEGAPDAEALLVDAQGVPFIVSKADFDAETGVTGATRLYAAAGFRDGLLLDLGEVPVPEPSTPVVTLLYGNTVTGADFTPGRVLLRTYDQMVEFVAPEPSAELASFPTWPVRRVTAPWQPQAEAVAYAADGCGYFSISEGTGDIWLVPCGPVDGIPVAGNGSADKGQP